MEVPLKSLDDPWFWFWIVVVGCVAAAIIVASVCHCIADVYRIKRGIVKTTRSTEDKDGNTTFESSEERLDEDTSSR